MPMTLADCAPFCIHYRGIVSARPGVGCRIGLWPGGAEFSARGEKSFEVSSDDLVQIIDVNVRHVTTVGMERANSGRGAAVRTSRV